MPTMLRKGEPGPVVLFKLGCYLESYLHGENAEIPTKASGSSFSLPNYFPLLSISILTTSKCQSKCRKLPEDGTQDMCTGSERRLHLSMPLHPVSMRLGGQGPICYFIQFLLHSTSL
jgi:hypothetical protein